MKTAIAVFLVLIAVVAVVLALHFYPPTSAPAVKPSAVGRVAVGAGMTPTAVVTAYLQALERKDYRKAYAWLSADSKQVHSYDDFVTRAEKGGQADYDLTKAKEEPTSGNSVTVVVPFIEDPASAGFNLVKEDGAWRVIFIGGVPTFPYAETR